MKRREHDTILVWGIATQYFCMNGGLAAYLRTRAHHVVVGANRATHWERRGKCT